MNETYEEKVAVYIDSVLPKQFSYERKKVSEDWLKKSRMAEGIVSDFVRRVEAVEGKRILDIGFGNGLTLKAFADQGGVMSGLEVSKSLFSIATDVLSNYGVSADLKTYDGFTFPFANESFDFIYSVSVLEHVDDPVAVLKEASRVLRYGGSFYLAFPNRFNPKETHTGIWFASYLPRKVADLYLKMCGRSGVDMYWNVHFLSFFKLKRFLKEGAIPMTIRFETESLHPIKRFIKKTLALLGLHHSIFLPHIMVILDKKK